MWFYLFVTRLSELRHHGIEDDCVVRVDPGQCRGRTGNNCIENDFVSWRKSFPRGFEKSRQIARFVSHGN